MKLKDLAAFVDINPPLHHTRFYPGSRSRCSEGCKACAWKRKQLDATIALTEVKNLLKEIRDACAVFPPGYQTPIEEPDLDGPWLPVGILSKVHEILEGLK